MTAAQPSHKIQLKITFLGSPPSSPPMNVMIEELSVSGVMDAFLFAWFSSADHAPKETEDNSTFGNQWKFVWSPDLPKKDLFLTRYDKELQHYRRVGFLTLYAKYPDKLANDMGELLSSNVGREFFQDPRLSFQQFLQILHTVSLDRIVMRLVKIFFRCNLTEWANMFLASLDTNQELKPKDGNVVDGILGILPINEWKKRNVSYLEADRFFLFMDSHSVLVSLYDMMMYEHERHVRFSTLGTSKVFCSQTKLAEHAVHDAHRGYYPTSASMMALDDGHKILVMQRAVNYTIVKQNGSYIYDGQVKTENYWIVWDPRDTTDSADHHILQSIDFVHIPAKFSLRKGYILGMEDVRVFGCLEQYPHRLYTMATTVEYGAMDYTPSQVLNVFDKDTKELQGVYDIHFESGRCQKNWCPYFSKDNKFRMLYSWTNEHLTVLEVPLDEQGNPHVNDPNSKPPRVSYTVHHLPITIQKKCRRLESFRGSTSPIYIPEAKKWFVTIHEVYHEPGISTRRYRHRVLSLPSSLLDDLQPISEQTEGVRVSVPFVFETNQIEYTLGMMVMQGTMYFHYSTWDNSSNMLEMPLEEWLDWFDKNSTEI